MAKRGRDAYGRFLPAPRRGERGKFARAEYRRPVKPRRDELGKFAPKKPVKRPKRLVPKRRRKPERPLVAVSSREAEILIQERLLDLARLVVLAEPGVQTSVQSFCNKDGTVDGELCLSNLPDEWRTAQGSKLLAASLSNVLRAWRLLPARPPMGGAFWISFGARFGPRNRSEAAAMEEYYRRYKRHRGLVQVGTYPSQAWAAGAVQLALVGDAGGLRFMVERFRDARGLAPHSILIRIVWTPDGARPGHYKGEK